MGVYISGMEMPTTYPLTVTIYPDGQVLSETVGAKDKHGIAVPVPPHGRLGDLDELLFKLPAPIEDEYKHVRRIVVGAPTIIPSDPAEEGET